MARPATKTTQEKINDVKENIVKKENELKQLKAALKELEVQKISEEKDELYNYLRNNLNKSKNNIKSLLKNECIYVNNNVITKYNFVVNSGDIISIGKAITYKDVNLKIIYEDSDIIVIDKPTKILTISNSKEKEKTLYREVSNYLKMENKKVFVIHRLDYDTSGVIMFAKNQKVQKLYQDKRIYCYCGRHY